MRHPGIERWALLNASADSSLGYSLSRGTTAGPGALVVINPGHEVRLEGVELRIIRPDGDVISLADGVRDGRARILPGYRVERQRLWFQVAVRNSVWGSLIPGIVAAGEDLDQWDLQFDRARLVLVGPKGQTMAEVQDDGWWRIQDPDRTADYAGQLLEGSDLRARWPHGLRSDASE